MEVKTIEEIIPEQIIPEQVVVKYKYIAEDGKEFDNECMCEWYEEQLMNQRRPVEYSKYITFLDFDFCTCLDDSHKIFNIQSKEEYEYVLTNHCCFDTKSDYETFGNGLYLCFYFDGGDGPDWCYLCNFDNYLKRFRDSLEKYEKDVKEHFGGQENDTK